MDSAVILVGLQNVQISLCCFYLASLYFFTVSSILPLCRKYSQECASVAYSEYRAIMSLDQMSELSGYVQYYLPGEIFGSIIQSGIKGVLIKI